MAARGDERMREKVVAVMIGLVSTEIKQPLHS